ncbi:hypothetical protein D082_03190 [Synechocystis sp. PCC 6714]|nr:hypothetical protein D082_03190 [Synechocystis sp. PCC 6714]
MKIAGNGEVKGLIHLQLQGRKLVSLGHLGDRQPGSHKTELLN